MRYRLEVQRELYGLVRQVVHVQRERAWVPVPGTAAASTAAADKRWSDPAWGQRPMRDAYLFAALPLAASQDHIELLAHSLGTGPIAFAYSTVARGAMEAAGRAWWLLEPGIDDARRLGRYMTERLYSWQETARLADGIEGSDGKSRAQQVARIERLGACAERHGFHVRRERQLPVSVGEPRPSSTKLLDDVLAEPSDGLSSGATIYRMLSASAHATLYGLLQPTRVLRLNEDGSSLAGVVVDDDLLAQITLGPVLSFSRAVTSFSAHWGWDDVLQDWGDRVRALADLLTRPAVARAGGRSARP